MKKNIIMSLFWICAASIFIDAATSHTMPYPEGFRKWVHIKTTLTGIGVVPQRKFDGFHHIYANEKAVTGYETGHFPDGAIIVFDKQTVDTLYNSNNTLGSGTRKYIDVMYKDSKAFSDTGGWGFEEFTGDSRTEGRLSIEQQQSCFTCHKSQKDADFVFSKLTK